MLRYQRGMTEQSIEGLARKLAEAVPEGLKSVGDEVQEAVLARTREKLEALEARLAELEK